MKGKWVLDLDFKIYTKVHPCFMVYKYSFVMDKLLKFIELQFIYLCNCN